ncbi:MAG: hypothetical protein K6T26_03655 [Alicyclobacillus sp.]|nr:hypothetical protein [Alicyclobacillus sp.]
MNETAIRVNWRRMWCVLAFGLTNPGAWGWAEALPEVQGWVTGLLPRNRAKVLERALADLANLPAEERAQLYWRTFAGGRRLALSRLEFSDTRYQQAVRTALRLRLSAAGWPTAAASNVDALPGLMEFLANAPRPDLLQDLEQRIKAACRKLAGEVPDDNPYRRLLQMAGEYWTEGKPVLTQRPTRMPPNPHSG